MLAVFLEVSKEGRATLAGLLRFGRLERFSGSAGEHHLRRAIPHRRACRNGSNRGASRPSFPFCGNTSASILARHTLRVPAANSQPDALLKR